MTQVEMDSHCRWTSNTLNRQYYILPYPLTHTSCCMCTFQTELLNSHPLTAHHFGNDWSGHGYSTWLSVYSSGISWSTCSALYFRTTLLQPSNITQTSLLSLFETQNSLLFCMYMCNYFTGDILGHKHYRIWIFRHIKHNITNKRKLYMNRHRSINFYLLSSITMVPCGRPSSSTKRNRNSYLPCSFCTKWAQTQIKS